MWQKLSNIPVSTGLNVKSGLFERKRSILKKLMKCNLISVQCYLQHKFGCFCADGSFWGICIHFRCMMFLKSCWKNYYVSWSMSVKSPIVGCLFKCCFQRTSPLLIRNIEHSRDQVTSRKILSKNRKLLSFRCPFLQLGLKKSKN